MNHSDSRVVLENDRLIIIDKPAGWLAVPSRLGERDARPCAGRFWQQALARRLWPVHRLDVEVSGLLLFTKDAEAHRMLCEAFLQQRIGKTYLACTPPVPSIALHVTQTWQTRLLRGKKRAYEHPRGKVAVTQATPLLHTDRFTLWRLAPRTGRPHQLRVELFIRGFPIVGDHLYGSAQGWHPGIALRAVQLDFSLCAATLGLPTVVRADQRDDVSMGMAFWTACATSAGHSIQTLCPAEGKSTGAV